MSRVTRVEPGTSNSLLTNAMLLAHFYIYNLLCSTFHTLFLFRPLEQRRLVIHNNKISPVQRARNKLHQFLGTVNIAT